MATEVECPICGGSDPKNLGNFSGNHVYRCRYCGGQWAQPTEEQLTQVDLRKAEKKATQYVKNLLKR